MKQYCMYCKLAYIALLSNDIPFAHLCLLVVDAVSYCHDNCFDEEKVSYLQLQYPRSHSIDSKSQEMSPPKAVPGEVNV